MMSSPISRPQSASSYGGLGSSAMARAMSINSLSTILGRQHALRRARTQLELHQDEEREYFDGSEASLQDGSKDRSHLETFLVRLPYYVPVFKWLPEYNWTLFRYDLFSGITVATMIIPTGLAYADLAQLPSSFGLSAACFPLLAYSVFGSSRQLAVGPEAIVVILTGMQLSEYEGEQKAYACFLLAFLVGIVALSIGLLRLGFIDSILSRPLLRGFIIAVGLQIITEQVPKALAFTSHPEDEGGTFIDHASFLLSHLHETNGYAAAFSVPCMLFLASLNFAKTRCDAAWLKNFPGILVAVVLSTVLSAMLKWHEKHGVPVVGTITAGFKMPTPPGVDIEMVNNLLPGAMVIFLVGFVESIAVGKEFANKYQYRLSANRELVAFGMTNIVGAFTGCFPTFGSMARSKIQDSAGGKTQATGAIVACIVIVSVVGFLDAFYYLPKSVLAGIVITAAMGLLELHDMDVIIRIRAWRDFAMFMFTFLCTLILGLIPGIMISACVSLLLVVKHTTIPRLVVLGRTTDADGNVKYKNIEEFPEAETTLDEGLMIISIEQSLYFANMGQMKDNLRRIEQLGSLHAHPSEKANLPPLTKVIFNLAGVVEMDASAVQILVEIVEQYLKRGVVVCFVKLRSGNEIPFHKSGLADLVGPDHIFSKITDAVDFLLAKRPGLEVHDSQASGGFVFSREFERNPVRFETGSAGSPAAGSTQWGLAAVLENPDSRPAPRPPATTPTRAHGNRSPAAQRMPATQSTTSHTSLARHAPGDAHIELD